MTTTPESSGTHLWLVLMKAHRALQRVAERSIRDLDLGLSDFAVLEMLLHKGPLPVSTIGRSVGLTSGAITTAVDRLESRDFVRRDADPNDRRARIVCLTGAGKSMITELFALHQGVMDEAGEVLRPEERATLIALLKKLGIAATMTEGEAR